MDSANLTSDIKTDPEWLNLFRRLQSVACPRRDGESYAVLSIRILVDEQGIPRCWTEPTRIRVEPKAGRLEKLLDLTKPE